ncbi:fluoride efflux transporter FluC [Microbacterium dauci]|uniref:Fluoride-specific ion channel FluC n=1 Tax=Microbacterium dauci TaxID=3048008 RepID=A0ABT6ZCR6_9MICO|nr:CrcB family protein [Microbacterium sp. LX3-4]MDJ1113928.1 CrcB family protein [Microbacterium sp. LX3-4]
MIALVIVAGGVGAGLRFLVDTAIGARRPGAFPFGILIVNIVGSFGLGLVVGFDLLVDATWVTILGVGLLGGFTTFSTVAVDSARFARRGRRDLAWGNLLGTFAACAVAAAAGLMLGGVFAG